MEGAGEGTRFVASFLTFSLLVSGGVGGPGFFSSFSFFDIGVLGVGEEGTDGMGERVLGAIASSSGGEALTTTSCASLVSSSMSITSICSFSEAPSTLFTSLPLVNNELERKNDAHPARCALIDDSIGLGDENDGDGDLVECSCMGVASPFCASGSGGAGELASPVGEA